MITPDKMTQKAVSTAFFVSVMIFGSKVDIRVPPTVRASCLPFLDNKVALLTRLFVFC